MQITLVVLNVKKEEMASHYKLCHFCKGVHFEA